MISYLGSLDQFSPAAGRAGRCWQMSLCWGGHSPFSGPAASSPGALSPGAARPLPPWRAAWAARGLQALSIIDSQFVPFVEKEYSDFNSLLSVDICFMPQAWFMYCWFQKS